MLSIALLLDEIETSWFDCDINNELKCYSLSHISHPYERLTFLQE